MSKNIGLELLNEELNQKAEYLKSFYIQGRDLKERSQNYIQFQNYFEKTYSTKTIVLQEEPYLAKWYENENANELIENIQDIYNKFFNLKQSKKEEKQPVKITKTTLF